MPVLKNARHEKFAQLLAKGEMSADEAYQKAGYKPNRKNASRLKTKEDIRKRVGELTGPAIRATEITAQKVLEQLWTEATRTGEGTSHSARVAALTALGKYHKLFTDKFEADVNVNDVSDGRARLEHLLARHTAGRDKSKDPRKLN